VRVLVSLRVGGTACISVSDRGKGKTGTYGVHAFGIIDVVQTFGRGRCVGCGVGKRASE
jgi:hypothetical protein